MVSKDCVLKTCVMHTYIVWLRFRKGFVPLSSFHVASLANKTRLKLMSQDLLWHMVKRRLMGKASRRDDYNCLCLMKNSSEFCWKEVAFYQLPSSTLWGYQNTHLCHHYYHYFHHSILPRFDQHRVFDAAR